MGESGAATVADWLSSAADPTLSENLALALLKHADLPGPYVYDTVDCTYTTHGSPRKFVQKRQGAEKPQS